MITVTFDSNVWENIVDPSKRAGQPIYENLYKAILEQRIKPFFSAVIINIEAIPSKDRKSHYSEYTLNAENEYDYELHDYLQDNIPKAVGLGFRFLSLPRIGARSHSLVENNKADDELYSLKERLDRSFECGRFIENLGAGKDKVHTRLDGESQYGLVIQSSRDTSLSDKQYSKDIGEWADGDAIASHYGYGIDYFCTNDMASSAGTKSVFHADNVKKLEDKFRIRIVRPETLINYIA